MSNALQQIHIEYAYEYFYRKFYNTNYKFKPSQKVEKCIDEFLNELRKSPTYNTVGYNWLFDYTLFQFHYWSKLDIKLWAGKIQFPFIFGEKAFNRYLERNKDFDGEVVETCVQRKIYKPAFTTMFYTQRIEKETFQFFVRQKRDLQMCLISTSLFDPNNIDCKRCDYQDSCKELLRVNLPNIYKIRF